MWNKLITLIKEFLGRKQKRKRTVVVAPKSTLKPVQKKTDSLDIDWDFIASLEGFEVNGYVPQEENEKKTLN